MNQVSINSNAISPKQQLTKTNTEEAQGANSFMQTLAGIMGAPKGNGSLEEVLLQWNRSLSAEHSFTGIEPPAIEHLVEGQINDDESSILQAIWAQFVTIIQNESNTSKLSEDISNWYNGLSKEQQITFKSNFNHLFESQNIMNGFGESFDFPELIKFLSHDNSKWNQFKTIITGQVKNDHIVQTIDLSKTHDMVGNINLDEDGLGITDRQLYVSKESNKNEGVILPLDLKQLQFTTTQFSTKVSQTNFNVDVNNFTSELGKIIMKNVKLPNGVTEMKIQLHPLELGKIDIKLSSHQGQLTAQLLTETVVGKELLENHLHMLKQSLVQQGYQVERIEVQSASNSSNLGQGFNESFSFNHQSPNQHQHKGQALYDMEVSNGELEPTEDMIDELNYHTNTFGTGIDYTV